VTRCHFCDREAQALCTHRLTEPYIVFPEEILVGDLIEHSLALTFHPCIHSTFTATTRPLQIHDEDRFMLTLQIGRGQQRTQHHRVTIPLLRLETHPCGRPACERHMREFGEGAFQCMAHWELKVYSGE
jgi:hypothetical protein